MNLFKNFFLTNKSKTNKNKTNKSKTNKSKTKYQVEDHNGEPYFTTKKELYNKIMKIPKENRCLRWMTHKNSDLRCLNEKGIINIQNIEKGPRSYYKSQKEYENEFIDFCKKKNKKFKIEKDISKKFFCDNKTKKTKKQKIIKTQHPLGKKTLGLRSKLHQRPNNLNNKINNCDGQVLVYQHPLDIYKCV